MGHPDPPLGPRRARARWRLADGVVAPAEVDERTAVFLTSPQDDDHRRAHRDPVAVD